MSQDCVKLTIYFGEHRRVGRELLSDALVDVYHRHRLEASVLLRGTEGFGARHTLHTQRLLTLSEDLPLVSVAVDERTKVERALPEVRSIVTGGLVTLERARMLSGSLAAEQHAASEETKLTVYCGRAERAGRQPAYQAVIQLLHDRGIAGATALLGLDGLRHGVRQRARFFSRNADVPLMIVSVGDGATIAAALPDIEGLLERPLATLERVSVSKRDGRLLASPPLPPATTGAEPVAWQKLMVYAGEQARHRGHSLHLALIRRLREQGAAGATALRGIWGYSGNHPPHGERLWPLRRSAPIVTVLIDRPERMQRWWRIVDEVTGEAGLVTSEMVPVHRALEQS